MKTSFLLLLLPVLFLVSTGFIYANWQTWNSTCQGSPTCSTTVSSNVSTTNPLFNLIVGNYTGLFHSLQNLLFRSTPYGFTVPWFALQWTPTALPSFYVPTLQLGSFTVGGNTITIPNWIGGQFYLTIPSITIPTLRLTEYYVSLGSLDFPTIISSGYDVSLPSLTFAAISLIVGGIMIFLGLGIGVTLANSGYEINSTGSRTLTVVGTGVVLWTFISLFTGSWLLSLDYGWGTIITSFLELLFIIGVYAHVTDAGGM